MMVHRLLIPNENRKCGPGLKERKRHNFMGVSENGFSGAKFIIRQALHKENINSNDVLVFSGSRSRHYSSCHWIAKHESKADRLAGGPCGMRNGGNVTEGASHPGVAPACLVIQLSNQLLHLRDFFFLRLDNCLGQFADSRVTQLGTLTGQDCNRVVGDHRLHP